MLVQLWSCICAFTYWWIACHWWYLWQRGWRASMALRRLKLGIGFRLVCCPSLGPLSPWSRGTSDATASTTTMYENLACVVPPAACPDRLSPWVEKPLRPLMRSGAEQLNASVWHEAMRAAAVDRLARMLVAKVRELNPAVVVAIGNFEEVYCCATL